MSDDLVEEVVRAICFSRNAPTCVCTKETGCLASVMVRVDATQARAAIAAVAEWMIDKFSYQAEMIEVKEAICAALRAAAEDNK